MDGASNAQRYDGLRTRVLHHHASAHIINKLSRHKVNLSGHSGCYIYTSGKTLQLCSLPTELIRVLLMVSQ
jgi:hypothetical protein